MKLIIDISEEDYKEVLKDTYSGTPFENKIFTAVANGIPLPKGHGDLVDLNQLDSRMYHEAFETDTDLQKWDSGCWIRYKMYEDIRDTAPTIVEADRAERRRNE